MINDTEKRLNLLFDMLNCETLSEASHARILEIVKGAFLPLLALQAAADARLSQLSKDETKPLLSTSIFGC